MADKDIDTIEKEIERFNNFVKSKGFIKNMFDTIYFDEPVNEDGVTNGETFSGTDDLPLVDGEWCILSHNAEIIDDQKERISAKKGLIANAQPLREVERPKIIETPIQENQQDRDIKDYDNITKVIEMIKAEAPSDLVISRVIHLTSEELKVLKIRLYASLQEEKALIHSELSRDVTTPIEKRQNVITRLYIALEDIIATQSKEPETKETIVMPEYQIYFVPYKNRSYFLNDIRNYPEAKADIRIAFDKILSGYFMQNEMNPMRKFPKLYEYRNPKTGLRIMYEIDGDSVFICNFFYKDAQKSTRISQIYEESFEHIEAFKQEFISRRNDPEFYIEQEQLVGEIQDYLQEEYTLAKKVGK